MHDPPQQPFGSALTPDIYSRTKSPKPRRSSHILGDYNLRSAFVVCMPSKVPKHLHRYRRRAHGVARELDPVTDAEHQSLAQPWMER